MAVLNLKTSHAEKGIEKGIDKDSKDIALDILQRGIYAYPERSMVRELASNAFDAILERDIAKGILKGEIKVEDHFDLTKDNEGVFKASGWDPDYFDPHYLSDDPGIYISYTESTNTDTFRIRDFGVGLGATRLVGYFQLAFSTKRQSKSALGRWGLGNKSPLALGIDAFTVINIYNGRKFMFEVSLATVTSITPKFSNGKANDYIIVSVPQEQPDGSMVMKDFTFYFEETDEKNGLEVIVPVKKYMQKEIIDGIEEQLMYIPNVVYKFKGENDMDYRTEDISAKVLYRDNDIVISESTLFDRPHILLGVGDGLINYGMVDFKALELEPKKGAVGLILDVNDVEVTPSRESVVWSPKTRKAIIRKYENIVETATRMINKDLNTTTDYFEWYLKAATVSSTIKSSSQGNSVIAELSNIVDISQLGDLHFVSPDIQVKYESGIHKMLGVKDVGFRSHNYNKYSRKVDRKPIVAVAELASYKKIYVSFKNADRYVDRYLHEQNGDMPIAVLRITDETDWKAIKRLNLVVNSSIMFKYDEIEVPDDIMAGYLSDDISEDDGTSDEVSATPTLTPWQRELLRRQQQKVIYHYMYNSDGTFTSVEETLKDFSQGLSNKIAVVSPAGDRSLLVDTMRILPSQVSIMGDKYAAYGSSRTAYLEDAYSYILGGTSQNKWVEKNLYPYKNKIRAVLARTDLVDKLADVTNSMTTIDFIVKSYKNGILELSDIISFYLTMKPLYDKFSNLELFSAVSQAANILDKYHGQGSFNASEAENFKALFGPIFEHLQYAHMITNIKSTYSPPTFYAKILRYHLAVANDDMVDAANVLDDINATLPDELCDKIDEITEIRGFNYQYYKVMLEYINYFEKFKWSLKSFNKDYYAPEPIEELSKLILNYEKPPITRIPDVFEFGRSVHERDHGESSGDLQIGQGDPGDDTGVSENPGPASDGQYSVQLLPSDSEEREAV